MVKCKNEMLQGASLAFILKIGAAGLVFVLSVVLARVLGAEQLGLYQLVISILTIAATVGRIGLDNTVVRFIASNTALGCMSAVRGVYYISITLVLMVSSAVAATVFFISPFLAVIIFNKPELNEPLCWAAIAVVPLALSILHAHALQGLKRIGESVVILNVLVPCVALIVVFMSLSNIDALGAVRAYILGTLVSVSIGTLLWHKWCPYKGGGSPSFPVKELLRSCIPLFVVALLNLIVTWAPVIFLGVFGTYSDVAIYGVTNRTAILIGLILVAVNQVAAPKFAALHQLDDNEALASTAAQATRIMALTASPFVFLLLVIPEEILSVFGEDYIVGGNALRVLALGQLVNVATGSVGYLLMMTGHEKVYRNGLITSALFSLLLNALLIPHYGYLGGAIASSLGLMFLNIYIAYLVWTHLGIAIWSRKGQ